MLVLRLVGGNDDGADQPGYIRRHAHVQDVSSFDTSQVTALSYMFYGCTGLTSLCGQQPRPRIRCRHPGPIRRPWRADHRTGRVHRRLGE